MLAYSKYGSGKTPTSENMKGDHFVGDYYVLFNVKLDEEVNILVDSGLSKDDALKESSLMKEAQQMLIDWENGVPCVLELWNKMNSWVYEGFDETYKTFGISFEKYYYESDTYKLGKDIILTGLDKGVFYIKDDGSVWCDLSEFNLGHKLLLRSDGTSVYITQDIGTSDLKYNNFKFDETIFVVGNEQEYHFKVLFNVLKKLNKVYADNMYHLSYGMIYLPDGRMKSREGNVIEADNLFKEVTELAKELNIKLDKKNYVEADDDLFEIMADAAIKYYLLKYDSKKDIIFDPQKSLDFEENSSAYIQYTYTRINTIIEKDDSKLITEDCDYTLNDYEKNLIIDLYNLKDTIEAASNNLNPSIIAAYLYNLCKSYNTFYSNCNILKSNDNEKNIRMSITKLTEYTIKKCSGMLGFRLPKKM